MATITTSRGDSFVSTTRPLTRQLEEIVETWAKSQYELVMLAAEFADSPEWIVTGSPTAAHWLAIIADVEPCTAREWIRIGRLLKTLPATADALKTRQISYSKARTLTRLSHTTERTGTARHCNDHYRRRPRTRPGRLAPPQPRTRGHCRPSSASAIGEMAHRARRHGDFHAAATTTDGRHVDQLLDRMGYAITADSCLLYTSPSPRDATLSRMPSSA